MKAERWRRVEELFHETLDQPPEARDGWLTAACADDLELRREVESLLAAGEHTARVEQAVRGGFELAVSTLPDEAPERIGPYRILREVGRGGTGIVYEAEREGEVRQRVAVKVIKRGMDTDEILDRLRRERQILADLEHPNIARLIDGGSTEDGRPYFAMEMVEGEALDVYCDRRQLSVEERLRLFLGVCAAVQHAHQNLIIHRDLKPSNILITAGGEPKLLDFGIAKLLAATDSTRTMTGANMLTPDYASPEQLQADPLTTATDVYSLGVVLYRLLTGRPPYPSGSRSAGPLGRPIELEVLSRPSTVAARSLAGGPSAEDLAASRREKPSGLGRRLRGDLDNIVLFAMRREPERRYSTVGEFADDLRRHLELRPVRARPASFGYQLGRTLRRYRAASIAAGLALASLVGGLAATIHQARVADRHRLHAESVTDFLTEIFRVADPGEARGNEVRAREILDRGAARIEQLVGQEEVQAQLLSTMGLVYQNLGLFQPAADLYQRAGELRLQLFGDEDPEWARSLTQHADVLLELGELEHAEKRLEQALEVQRRVFGDDHPDVAMSLDILGVVRFTGGDLESAETLLGRAVALRTTLLGELHADTAKSLNNLASVHFQRGNLREAETLFRRAVAIRLEVLGEDHPDTVTNLGNLATVLLALGELSEAEALQRQVLAAGRRLLGDDHPEVATSLNNLADLERALGNLDAAVADFRSAADILARALGEDHPRRGAILLNLGDTLRSAEREEQAEVVYQEALGLFRAAYPDGHWRTGHALMRLGNLFADRGDCSGAVSFFEQAVDVRGASYDPGHWRVAEAQSALAGCLGSLGRLAEAEALLRACLVILEAEPEAAALAKKTRERLGVVTTARSSV